MNRKRLEHLKKLISDNEAFYITNSNDVFYYSGFSGEGSLIITKEKNILVTDSRYTEDAKRRAEAFEVADIKNGLENIYPKNAEKFYADFSDITVSGFEQIKSKISASFSDGADKIKEARRVKDEEEIKLIKTACDIALHAFKKVIEDIVIGKTTERQAAAEFEYICKQNGADSLSFDTIIASGTNSSMPHARASDKIIENGDFITFDFGCKYKGYCSDMTRTLAAGHFSDYQKEIYMIVKKAQETALLSIKEGMICSDIDKVARDIISDAGYGENFGHSLGHSVGTFIHETPMFSPKCHDKTESGMVITVEPGIYLEGKFGVRIEDLTVIRGEKCEILTNFPKDLIII